MSSFVVDREALKQRLSSLEYNVTQNAITEEPFTGKFNEFWENGIYSCIVCDQQLFTSKTKYDSGCGWPAFFDSLDDRKLCFKPDHKKAPRIRTEITCSRCDAHLGHLFLNELKPKTGKRYCINSAALKFSHH
ncbi:methionine-R-sulfoxide reductase-like protein [Sarcoptes scabiei]|uniref:Peptide-methionine (R)-S-oxide reductase n=1 Tax=Sarcoptes scabiei TaxID=52283 RepID=A0A132AIU7_SARSC|nr:methionine-R-sulfoxide reductase-like protein [Sarcoptes scabiei]